jgi:hypothetical protein
MKYLVTDIIIRIERIVTLMNMVKNSPYFLTRENFQLLTDIDKDLEKILEKVSKLIRQSLK